MIVKELVLEYTAPFQAPNMGYSKKVQERMYMQEYFSFNSLNICKQLNIENTVPLSCLKLINSC